MRRATGCLMSKAVSPKQSLRRWPIEDFMEAVPDAMIVMDGQGRTVNANQRVTEVLGWPIEELKGRPIDLLIPERFHAAHARLSARFRANPRVRPMGRDSNLWARKSDGSEILVKISLYPWSDGESALVAVSFRSASEQVTVPNKPARERAEVDEPKGPLATSNVHPREAREELHPREDDIVGQSQPWRQVRDQMDLVAASDTAVLFLGETGTGKELLARALHVASPRRNRALIKVNCAALPATLIESELFGHEKGSFSGAEATRKGRFELADQGTLLLDEIGELPLELQSKLLHVLQSGDFERLGSSQTRRCDVRVIAATNRDLRREVSAGRFRADLYYRLAVFPIEVPPLRDRRDDVALLAAYFLHRSNAKHGKSIDTIPPTQMDVLMAHDWPGNVRELENLIERAVILSRNGRLDIGTVLRRGSDSEAVRARPPVSSSVRGPGTETLEDIERAHILRVLESTGWKVKGSGNAAERLGLNESTLRSRMKKLGIRRPCE